MQTLQIVRLRRSSMWFWRVSKSYGASVLVNNNGLSWDGRVGCSLLIQLSTAHHHVVRP
jgi:hypothetical protein